MFKSTKAITLIALIITIIVLLILAGVTINMVLGENGLFNKAKTSVAKYENAQAKENSVLIDYETEIDSARDTVTVSKEEYESLKNTVQELSNKSQMGFIDTNQLLVGVTDFEDGTTYTATENCAVLISTYGNSNRQGVYVKINDVVVWHCFDNNGTSQFTNTVYLKKGQVLTFQKDVAIPGGEHSYCVYKLD